MLKLVMGFMACLIICLFHITAPENSWLLLATAIVEKFKPVLNLYYTTRQKALTVLVFNGGINDRTKCCQQNVRKSGWVGVQIVNLSPFSDPEHHCWYTNSPPSQITGERSTLGHTDEKTQQCSSDGHQFRSQKYLYYLVIIFTFIVTNMFI